MYLSFLIFQKFAGQRSRSARLRFMQIWIQVIFGNADLDPDVGQKDKIIQRSTIKSFISLIFKFKVMFFLCFHLKIREKWNSLCLFCLSLFDFVAATLRYLSFGCYYIFLPCWIQIQIQAALTNADLDRVQKYRNTVAGCTWLVSNLHMAGIKTDLYR